MFLRQNCRGDTIIEVILALAVLGGVIVGGYSIATRSLRGVQASNERNEALKIAEGQIENLKYRFSTASTVTDLTSQDTPGTYTYNQIFGDFGIKMPIGYDDTYSYSSDQQSFLSPISKKPLGFCFFDDGSLQRFEKPDPDLNNASKYPPDCKKGIDERYKVYITSAPTVNGGSWNGLLYTVNVTWDGIGGNVERLQLNDRFGG